MARRLRHLGTVPRFAVAFRPLAALIWDMAQRTMSWLRNRLVPVAIVATLTISACSSSSNDAADPTTTIGQSGSSVARSASSSTSSTTTKSTSTSSPPTTVAATAAPRDADLRAAVRAYWDVYLDVGARTASLDAAALRARLGERATGDQLRQLVAFFTTNKNSAFVVRGELDIAPVVVTASAASAQVRDCYDDRTGLFRPDGSRVDTDNPLRHQVLMTLVLEGAAWKVASTTGEGFGCAA
jgi:hypothetical protein